MFWQRCKTVWSSGVFETDDPVSENQIMEPPEAAVSNDPTDISPGDKHYPAREMI